MEPKQYTEMLGDVAGSLPSVSICISFIDTRHDASEINLCSCMERINFTINQEENKTGASLASTEGKKSNYESLFPLKPCGFYSLQIGKNFECVIIVFKNNISKCQDNVLREQLDYRAQCEHRITSAFSCSFIFL